MRVVIEVEIRNMTHPTTKVKDGHDIQYLTYAFKKCTLKSIKSWIFSVNHLRVVIRNMLLNVTKFR